MHPLNYTAFKDRTPVLNEREEAALQRWIKRHPEAVESEPAPELTFTPTLRLSVKFGLALCAWGVVGGVAYIIGQGRWW